ncbi:hypothetical protein [Streptomyces flavalbus]|uniref:Integral membrane protein n=1 Tax=Streptomyces flavalbus TaxID=2665155 RepID=A0ABW2W8E4_9ACTN
MGIESDKVVYEYLSRVGDVAQQRQLPSAVRMRLVSQLRDEIDERRARAGVDTPAAVRRIIARLGSPDDVVSAAGPGAGAGSGAGSGVAPGAVVGVPAPREAESEPAVVEPRGVEPRVVERGARGDWWQERGPFGDEVPGFVGGIEIAEVLRPPVAEPVAGEEADAEEEVPAEEAPKRRLPRLPSLRGWGSPLLLLAAGLLVAGAVLGNLVPLAFGWLIVYLSRRLSRNEVRVAVMGLPGAALACGLLWLWGRAAGRWGEPIADGAMSDAVGEAWPWVVRGAAVSSAVFLVWRARRRG